MKIMILPLSLVLIFLTAYAQESPPRKDPQKGAINVEFTTGLNNTTPVGIDAKGLRALMEDQENVYPGYKGALLPKTAAYGGFLVDFQFHEVGALGFGFLYTPKGLWLFESNLPSALAQPAGLDQRKTFITVDYFDIPIFYKEYLKNKKISIRFGPVISMALLSKVRVQTELAGEKEKLKYRLGEGTDDSVYYTQLANERPKFVVPGFEAALNVGNTGGLQGSVVFGFSGSMLESVDLKSFIARLGVSYTFSK